MEVRLLDNRHIQKNPYSALIVSKTCPLHKHTFFEFSICISGTYKNYINGIWHEIKQGRIMLLRPEDTHYFLASTPHTARDIYISSENLKLICDSIDKDLYKKLLTQPLYVDFQVSNRQIQSLENKMNYFNYLKNKSTLSLDARRVNIIAEIFDLWQQHKNTESTNLPGWLETLLQSIDSTSFLTKSVDEVVATTNYSHTYVCKQFKKYMNTTLRDYLNDVKFSYALSLIEHNHININQLSELLGYSAPSNFIIAFKNKFGVSPAQWRKKY